MMIAAACTSSMPDDQIAGSSRADVSTGSHGGVRLRNRNARIPRNPEKRIGVNEMSLPRFKYSEMHPKHEVWGIAEYWGHEGQELVSHTDIYYAVESMIDDCWPTPISDIGTIEVLGFAVKLDCSCGEMPEEEDLVEEVCVVEVNALEWTRDNIPEWLTPTDEETTA